MTLQHKSLCYYPTSTLLIDDNKDFVTALGTMLTVNSQLFCYLYNSPQTALNFLNQQYQFDPFTRRCAEIDKEESYGKDLLNLDYRAIHKQIYNPLRFQEISSLIVDFSMPIMDGAEFCQAIHNPYIKKMMLTGEGDQNLAVELFNQHQIDKFFLKNKSQMKQILMDAILELQEDYFFDLSTSQLGKANGLSVLHDEAYLKLLNDIFHQVQALEYYILDNEGSILFLDQHAQPTWLIVVSEEEMHSYQVRAEYDGAPAAIIKALKKRSIVPYCHTMEDWQTLHSAWEKYTHPAQVLEGNQRYYYSLLTTPTIYELQHNKIISYRQFKDKNYAGYLKEQGIL